jgi:hypothetical protein
MRIECIFCFNTPKPHPVPRLASSRLFPLHLCKCVLHPPALCTLSEFSSVPLHKTEVHGGDFTLRWPSALCLNSLTVRMVRNFQYWDRLYCLASLYGSQRRCSRLVSKVTRCVLGSRAYAASYPLAPRGCFPVVKAVGAWSWPLTFMQCRGQECTSCIRIHGAIRN